MELVKINNQNVWEIVRLKVHDSQSDFVAPNDYSIIEAYATISSGYVALPFGLYEEGKPVGFVMVGYGTIGDEDEPQIAQNNYCIWRFMIDQKYQGRGLGKRAMKAVLEYIMTFPCGKAEYCWLSYEPDNQAARSLYRKAGFEETGEMDGDEIVAVKRIIAYE